MALSLSPSSCHCSQQPNEASFFVAMVSLRFGLVTLPRFSSRTFSLKKANSSLVLLTILFLSVTSSLALTVAEIEALQFLCNSTNFGVVNGFDCGNAANACTNWTPRVQCVGSSVFSLYRSPPLHAVSHSTVGTSLALSSPPSRCKSGIFPH